jgi:acetyl-CoA acyltransferase 1
MSHRVETLARHVGGAANAAAHNDDVVIVWARRTPITKAKRGGFATTTPDILLKAVLTAAASESGVPLAKLGDICVGNVLQPGGGAVLGRMAQFMAGIPAEVPLSAVNRQCSSGLQAVANIFGAIRTGSIDAGIGAGVESMSFNSMADSTPTVDFGLVSESALAKDCMIPMGVTSENVAERYGVCRADQDAFAERSQKRAAAAQASGAFAAELVPVTNKEGVVVAADDGVRGSTTAAGLAKLTPAFKEGGTTTAGNSSQVSDGAAAVVLVRRSLAASLGLSPLGVMRSFAVVGVPPDIMGIGPAFAIPAAVAQAGLTLDDIDVFEINEAFASQALYSMRKLGLDLVADPERVNPLGGAIALGHPLGATGARQVATLLHYMRRTGKRYGVVSMCIGTGMGGAAVFENEAGRSRAGR